MDVQIILGQTRFGEHPQECVIGGVGVGNGGDGLAFELARALDVRVFVTHELHQGARPQDSDRLHRNPLRSGNDGGVANGAANDRIARTHLFGHVHAAPPGHKIHLQTLLGVVALGLGDHPRSKRR